MTKYEYKTISLDQKGLGIVTSRSVPDLESTLNREGRDGWRLQEIFQPSAAFGESDKLVLVFIRETAS